MPGPFTHIFTARRLAEFLRSPQLTDDFIRRQDGPLQEKQKLSLRLSADLGPTKCADMMDKWPKFAAVGAIGPDLFFWLEDYNDIKIPSDEIMLAMSLLYYLDDQGRLDDPYDGLLTILAEVSDTWASILRFIVKLDQIWKKFLAIWNATIGPIVEKASQAIDDLTGGLLSSLGDALTELKNDILSLAQEELLTEGDIFGWFSLKMRKGYDEQAFLWSDMTHYRRTSVIPAQLISHAREMEGSVDPLVREHAEQLLAFALGWICHNGTDVIEHSFVNEQCGGPFRTHWQRHHLIENHIDGWNYECTKDGTLPRDDFIGWQESYPSIADSALYFAVQIPQGIDTLSDADKQGDLRKPLPEGTDKATEAKRKKLLDTDGSLPMWLAETIVKVFIEVYADPDNEGGDGDLLARMEEGPDKVPHPRNLRGQSFQEELHGSTALIGKWLDALGVDNVGMALDDLRKIIAPDPPTTIPEGFPFPWQVMTAYRFMLSWFKRAYFSTFNLDRPEPPTVALPPASDFTPGPPDFSGVSANDDPVSQTCEVLLALLDWVFKSIEKAAQLVYDIVKAAASAATWPAREALYDGIILPLWEAMENIRMVLVHLGYTMPQSQQLWPSGNLKRPNEVDETLVMLGHGVDSAFQAALAAAWDPLGNLDKDAALTNVGVREVFGAANPWLPVRVTKGQKPAVIPAMQKDIVEYQRPWGFPNQTNDPNINLAGNYLEMPLTTAGPYLTNTTPDLLLSAAARNLASNAARVLYQEAGCPTDTDVYNTAFVLHSGRSNAFDQDRYPGHNPLGDPVVFSAYLVGQIANNPSFVKSSFNLDADRGYGYLCWDWQRDPLPKGATQPQDDHLHVYPPPNVVPEGADGWVRPNPTGLGPNQYEPELKLLYRGRNCHEGQVMPQEPQVPNLAKVTMSSASASAPASKKGAEETPKSPKTDKGRKFRRSFVG